MSQKRSSDAFYLKALLTDKTFQAREIRRVLMFAVFYAFFTTVLLGFFYHYLIGGLVSGVSPLLFAAEDMNKLDEQMPGMVETLARWLLVMLVLNLAMTVAVGVYIVRKLGGPLLAIKRVVRQIGEGDMTTRLRRGSDEEFGELFDTLTVTIESLQTRIAAAQSRVETLAALKVDGPAREAIESVADELRYFKTSASTGSHEG